MINPAKHDIVAYQGATYNLTLTWTVDDVPVDLTNYTAAMQVRKDTSSTGTILDLSTDGGITLGGTAGTISINVSAATMGAASPGHYLYDLELDSGSEVTRLVYGSFRIDAEVTR